MARFGASLDRRVCDHRQTDVGDSTGSTGVIVVGENGAASSEQCYRVNSSQPPVHAASRTADSRETNLSLTQDR